MHKDRFHIDLEAVAKCFQIGEREAREWWADGRATALIMEMRVARILGGIRVTCQAPWDVEDGDGGRWEVRVCSSRGLHFLPNNQVGAGRKFSDDGFRNKLAEITGYAVCDVAENGQVDVWCIPSPMVAEWFDRGALGKGARLSRRDFRRFMRQMVLPW